MTFSSAWQFCHAELFWRIEAHAVYYMWLNSVLLLTAIAVILPVCSLRYPSF